MTSTHRLPVTASHELATVPMGSVVVRAQARWRRVARTPQPAKNELTNGQRAHGPLSWTPNGRGAVPQRPIGRDGPPSPIPLPVGASRGLWGPLKVDREHVSIKHD